MTEIELESAKLSRELSNSVFDSSDISTWAKARELAKQAGNLFEKNGKYKEAAEAYSFSAAALRGEVEHKYTKEKDEVFANIAELTFKAAVFYEKLGAKKEAADNFSYSGDASSKIKNCDLYVKINFFKPSHLPRDQIIQNYRNYELCEIAYRNAKRLFGEIGDDYENERNYYFEQVFKRKKNIKNLKGMIHNYPEAVAKSAQNFQQFTFDIIKLFNDVATSTIFDITCKYGLSIQRAMISSVILIATFSLLFSIYGNVSFNNENLDSPHLVQFTALTFVTMSDSAYSVNSDVGRWLVFFDSSAGLFFFALLTYTFVSKLQRK